MKDPKRCFEFLKCAAVLHGDVFKIVEVCEPGSSMFDVSDNVIFLFCKIDSLMFGFVNLHFDSLLPAFSFEVFVRLLIDFFIHLF